MKRKHRRQKKDVKNEEKIVFSLSNVDGLTRETQLALNDLADSSYINVFALLETHTRPNDLVLSPPCFAANH